jgi:hypothetical protein
VKKVLWGLLTLSYLNAALAADCSSLGITLMGAIHFHGPKDKRVVKTEFPPQWSIHSDYFDELYLQNNSDKKLKEVSFTISGMPVHTQQLNTNGTKLQFAVNFKKNILSHIRDYPTIMLMEVDEVCTQRFEFVRGE